MDSQKFKIIIIVTLAAFAALYLGVSAATAQVETIAWILGGLALVLLLLLGKNVWTLVPVFSVLGGTITFLPGYPSPWYAVTPVVAVMLGIRFLMRSSMFSYRFCWMDLLLVLQIIVLLQAFLRNPVTLSIFGGAGTTMIGGRPYVDYAVAIFAYFMLAIVKTDPATLRKVITCMIVVMLLDSLLKAGSTFSGGLAKSIGRIYSNVDYAANVAGAGYKVSFETTRFASFSSLSAVLGLVLFSFHRPLSCLSPLRPGRFFLACFTGIVSLLSGFRSEFIKLGCYFFAGSLIRRKASDILLGGAVVFVATALVLVTVGGTALPQAVQRAISFLPVEVDPDIRASAEGSADWRFEMWKLVLTSDRYISNKMLGDGFGYTAAEHQAQLASEMGFGGYRGDSIDAFIAKGSYHGWHVEAIRFTGVLGLLVGLGILLVFARHAWLLIRRHYDTSFFPYAAFIGIPFLIEPFFTLFVFGSYKGNFISFIAMSAMLRACYIASLDSAQGLAQTTQPVAPDPGRTVYAASIPRSRVSG